MEGIILYVAVKCHIHIPLNEYLIQILVQILTHNSLKLCKAPNQSMFVS